LKSTFLVWDARFASAWKTAGGANAVILFVYVGQNLPAGLFLTVKASYHVSMIYARAGQHKNNKKTIPAQSALCFTFSSLFCYFYSSI